MSKPIPLQSSFAAGVIKDLSKDQLPRGSVFRMLDFIPDELGAPLVSRSGWSYASAAIGSTKISMVAVVPFASGTQLVATTPGGRLFKITMPADVAGVSQQGAETDMGACSTADYQTWTFHRDTMFAFPKAGGEAIYKYTGTATSTVAAVPQAATGTVYKDRTWCAYNAANPNRIWWSDAGDPLTWSTGAGGWWVDADQPVEALASPGNVIMVFHQNRVSRIRGNPGLDDFILEGLFDMGVADKRSIVNWGNYVIWADLGGVYMSDGVSFLDLTEDKVNDYYRQVAKTADNAVGAIYRDHYMLSLYGSTGTPITFVFDMSKKRWWMFTNIKLQSAAGWPGGWTQPNTSGTYVDAERVYGGLANTNRVIRMDDMWIEAKTATDGDGTAVLGEVGLPYFRLGVNGSKRFRHMYTTYKSEQTLDLAVYSLENTALSLGTLPASPTEATRPRLPISRASNGFWPWLKMHAAGHTHIYGFEVDAWAEEGNR